MISDSVLHAVEQGKDALIGRLRDLVAIRTESSDPAYRGEGQRAAEWLRDWFASIEGEAVIHQLPAVARLAPNPIVTARFTSPGAKCTVLVYGHYDVQPAEAEVGWKTDPWTLTGPDAEGYLYGRGSIDDKGQVCSVIAAVEAYAKAGVPLPVNLVFVIEGMEESASEGLDDFVRANRDGLFAGASAVLICDTPWLGESTPTVIHALRGINYFEVTVSGPEGDMHSGTMGGVAWEPLNDLIHVFSRLRDGPMGKVRIPGFDDDLRPVSDEFRASIRRSAFDVAEYREKNGLPGFAVQASTDAIVVAAAFRPSLTIHGFGKVFPGPGSKTVIPGTAVGYMSTRLVPFQKHDVLAADTVAFLEKEFASLGSPNRMEVKVLCSSSWWYMDPDGPEFRCALSALTETFGTPAVPMAEGGSIPVAHLFGEFGIPVVLMSLGKDYNYMHGPNERHHVDCLTKGPSAVARFLEGLASL